MSCRLARSFLRRLITGIRSDLPGQITAQVSENVYDSPTGRSLLIPQGARLIGVYDSQVAFGQSRVLLVWTRLILPNGKSIVLERQPGADTAGYSGLEDQVDDHWGALFKAALLSTLLSVGSEAGTSGSQNDLDPSHSPWGVRELQSDWPADRRPQSQYPADPDDPAGIPRACDCQSGSCARALSRLRRGLMAKLKLGAIADDRPVKLTVELPAAVHRDLVAYADALSRETGQPINQPARLIAPILARFIASDRAFAKMRNFKRPQAPAESAGPGTSTGPS